MTQDGVRGGTLDAVWFGGAQNEVPPIHRLGNRRVFLNLVFEDVRRCRRIDHGSDMQGNRGNLHVDGYLK
jgi:hypothetical protein